MLLLGSWKKTVHDCRQNGSIRQQKKNTNKMLLSIACLCRPARARYLDHYANTFKATQWPWQQNSLFTVHFPAIFIDNVLHRSLKRISNFLTAGRTNQAYLRPSKRPIQTSVLRDRVLVRHIGKLMLFLLWLLPLCYCGCDLS